MTKIFAQTVAALSVAVTALAAPSFAYAYDVDQLQQLCLPYVKGQIKGRSNEVKTAVQGCAEVTRIVRGYGNVVDIEAIGPNLVSVTTIDGSQTVVRVQGLDNVIGMITTNGGISITDINGPGGNEVAGVNDGCVVQTYIDGSGNKVWTECHAD